MATTKRKHTWQPALFATVALLGASRLARAEDSEKPKEQAEQLFQEAKELMNAGLASEACPKLEQARKLDGGGGTLLALALCREQEGRTATALSDFRAALALADQSQRNDRIELATAHLASLEASVPRLAVSTAAVDTTALEVRIDGTPWPQENWNQATPIDPGKHVLTVTAPGQKQWRQELSSTPSAVTQLDIPAWPSPALTTPAHNEPTVRTPPPAPVPAPRSTPSASRLASYVLAGVGGAGLITGTYFGIRTIRTRNQAVQACGGTPCKDPEGVRLDHQSSDFGAVSTVAFSVGVAALAGSAILLITEKKEPASVSLGVAPSAHGFDFSAVGRF